MVIIYIDDLTIDGNATGGGGILVSTGHPSDPTVHLSYAIPAGKWCSSFQAEMKAVKKALEILVEETSIWKARIVSDSQSVLMLL